MWANSMVLEDASERLRGDKEFIMNALAIEQKSFVYKHAMPHLQDDPEVTRRLPMHTTPLASPAITLPTFFRTHRVQVCTKKDIDRLLLIVCDI